MQLKNKLKRARVVFPYVLCSFAPEQTPTHPSQYVAHHFFALVGMIFLSEAGWKNWFFPVRVCRKCFLYVEVDALNEKRFLYGLHIAVLAHTDFELEWLNHFSPNVLVSWCNQAIGNIIPAGSKRNSFSRCKKRRKISERKKLKYLMLVRMCGFS